MEEHEYTIADACDEFNRRPLAARTGVMRMKRFRGVSADWREQLIERFPAVLCPASTSAAVAPVYLDSGFAIAALGVILVDEPEERILAAARFANATLWSWPGRRPGFRSNRC